MRNALRKVSEWATAAWTTLDRKADTKLGFISAPLFGTLLGGGIPAWLASRLIAAAIVSGALWYVAAKYEAGVVAERDREWQAKLVKEVEAAEKQWRERAQRTASEVQKVSSAWSKAHDELSTYTDKLEALLRAKPAKTSCEVAPEVVYVLRGKVRRVNRGVRPLK